MPRPSRRQLLVAAPLVGAAAAGCTLPVRKDPYRKSVDKAPVPGSAKLPAGHEATVTTVCGQCAAGCSVDVRVARGRAVRISGHTSFPINDGGVGPKGQTGTEVLYHPDRLQTPLRRDGDRGSGRWKKATWDEALAAIGASLKELVATNDTRALLILCGQGRGPMRQLWERFARAFGTPNLVDHRSMTDGARGLAQLYMQGVNELPAWDWSRARYVLGMGSSHLESWCQTMHMMRAASELRRGNPSQRVKFVQFSMRHTNTSMKADEWYPLEPGSHGALALGLGHVLVKENLYDAAFVEQHCFGFEDWKDDAGATHRGFKAVLLEDGALEKVTKVTGVPARVIEQVARELAASKPAIVVGDATVGQTSNGLYSAMAVHALNALLGNVGDAGGMQVSEPVPLKDWAEVATSDAAKQGLAAPRLDGVGTAACPLGDGAIHALPQALASGQPYAAKAAFLYYSNPSFSKPGGKAWADALAKVPLVVSFSPLPDESTLLADWVLPDHTYLERFDLVEAAPALGTPVLGLRQPAVPALYDTRHTGDVVLALAKAVGGPVAEAFPWESYQASLEERLAGLVGQADANVEGEDADALLEAMKEAGGWWKKKATPKRSGFSTPSGKFEFYSQAIAARLKAAGADGDAALAALGVVARGDLLCMPHHEPPRFEGAADAYPFVLLPFRNVNYAEGGVRHQKRLAELPLLDVVMSPWRERVEVSLADAEKLGVKTGDKLQVETPAGSRVLYALVSKTTRPGTLGLPLGMGSWPPRPGEPSGGYLLLAPGAKDGLSGSYAMTGTRARARRMS